MENNQQQSNEQQNNASLFNGGAARMMQQKGRIDATYGSATDGSMKDTKGYQGQNPTKDFIEKGGIGSGKKKNYGVPQNITHSEHGKMTYSHTVEDANGKNHDHYYLKDSDKYADKQPKHKFSKEELDKMK